MITAFQAMEAAKAHFKNLPHNGTARKLQTITVHRQNGEIEILEGEPDNWNWHEVDPASQRFVFRMEYADGTCHVEPFGDFEGMQELEAHKF